MIKTTDKFTKFTDKLCGWCIPSSYMMKMRLQPCGLPPQTSEPQCPHQQISNKPKLRNICTKTPDQYFSKLSFYWKPHLGKHHRAEELTKDNIGILEKKKQMSFMEKVVRKFVNNSLPCWFLRFDQWSVVMCNFDNGGKRINSTVSVLYLQFL